MRPDYAQRNDTRFGMRVMVTAVVSSIPVWIGLSLAVFWDASIFVLLVVLVATLAIPLTVLFTRLRWVSCPACGRRIKVPWNSTDYVRGGMLRYTCDDCRIIWSTHLYPGSDL